jgi:hypothetical protein
LQVFTRIDEALHAGTQQFIYLAVLREYSGTMVRHITQRCFCKSTLARLAICVSVLSLPAWAVLGGDAGSVQRDQLALHGSLRVTNKQSYAVHEIQTTSNMTVREYVSAGKVFGVVWQGAGHPDMRQLLGSYFEQYERAIQNKRPGRGPLTVQQPGLVVQSAGHARSFVGRAYVPDMLPSDVRAEDIR